MEIEKFATGNPSELILCHPRHEMKLIRMKLDERPSTLAEEDRGKLERRLFEIEERLERVT
jgi:hypothetical protein